MRGPLPGGPLYSRRLFVDCARLAPIRVALRLRAHLGAGADRSLNSCETRLNIGDLAKQDRVMMIGVILVSGALCVLPTSVFNRQPSDRRGQHRNKPDADEHECQGDPTTNRGWWDRGRRIPQSSS